MAMLYAGMQVPGEAVAVNSVSMGDNFFQPASLNVAVGQAVDWKNTGNLPHTATADTGSFDSGLVMKTKTFSQVFEVPGTFTYACAVHPEMVGTVVVAAAAPAETPAPTAAPAASANPAVQPEVRRRLRRALPVGGGPPLAPGTAQGAIALVVIGVAFAVLGGGAMTLAARTKQDAC
jgi:plastocyanin